MAKAVGWLLAVVGFAALLFIKTIHEDLLGGQGSGWIIFSGIGSILAVGLLIVHIFDEDLSAMKPGDKMFSCRLDSLRKAEVRVDGDATRIVEEGREVSGVVLDSVKQVQVSVPSRTSMVAGQLTPIIICGIAAIAAFAVRGAFDGSGPSRVLIYPALGFSLATVLLVRAFPLEVLSNDYLRLEFVGPGRAVQAVFALRDDVNSYLKLLSTTGVAIDG